MILIDIFEQREPYQQAIDALEQRRIEQVREKIDVFKKSLAKATDDEMRQAIKDRIQELEKELVGHHSVKSEAQQPQQTPAKGLLKGKDLVTPQQRVAGATPAKPGMAGAVKDVVGGVKRWLKGEPDQGPTFEQETPDKAPGQPFELTMVEPTSNAQAIYQQLKQAYKAEAPSTIIPFIGEKDPQKQYTTLSKNAIYNALVAITQIQQKNRAKYIEKNFADYDSFINFVGRLKPYQYRRPPKSFRIQKQAPVEPTVSPNPPQTAPGGPIYEPQFQQAAGVAPKKPWDPFGEINERKSQKKKSSENGVLDVKLNREIQKARARFPTAASDVEALALDQMTVNDQQDSVIQNLEKELNTVQDKNQTLSQTVQNMNSKIAQLSVPKTPAPVTTTPAEKPAKTTKPAKEIPTIALPDKEPAEKPAPVPADVSAKDAEAREEIARLNKQIQQLELMMTLKQQPEQQADLQDKIEKLSATVIDLEAERQARQEKQRQAAEKAAATRAKKKAAQDDVDALIGKIKKQVNAPRATMHEHGGGIGPRQHWQSLMREGTVKNAMYDYKIVGDEEFLKTYGMTKRQFYDTMISAKKSVKKPAYKAPASCPQCGQSHEQCVCEGTAQQFGQAVRMAGYTGRELEKDPAYKKSVQHAQQEREQSQRNLERVKHGYGQEPDEYHDIDETFAMPGSTVPRKAVIQGYTVFFNPDTKIVSVTRRGDSEEAAIEQQRMGTVSLKNFRQTAERLIDKIENNEQMINESAKDVVGATAVIACLLTGGSLTGCATAPQQTSAQQVLKTGQDIGRTVQSAKKITRTGVEAEVQQEIRNVMRGIGGHPEELNNSNILRIWRRLKGQPPVPAEPEAPEYGPAEPKRRMPQTESQEPTTKQEFDRALDGFYNQLRGETNPETRKRVNQELRQLQDLGRARGWFKGIVREDTAALAAEDAILKRIFVKHKNLMMEYGPDKITQAAEEVSYNVGDIAHITEEQVNEWVKQVEYILGARP